MHHKLQLKDELQDAWKIALLKKNAMNEVAGDEKRNVTAFIIIIVAAVLGLVGQQLFPIWFKPSLGAAIGLAVSQIVMMIIGIYVISVIAKSIFGGKGSHGGFFRAIAYGYIVMWVSLIPHLSIVGAIWALVIGIVVLTTVHKLSAGGVIGTIIVGIVAMGLISWILSPVFGALGMNSMQGRFYFSGGKNYFNVSDDSFNYNFSDPGNGGKMDVSEGGMKITTPEGKTFEINLPTQ